MKKHFFLGSHLPIAFLQAMHPTVGVRHNRMQSNILFVLDFSSFHLNIHSQPKINKKERKKQKRSIKDQRLTVVKNPIIDKLEQDSSTRFSLMKSNGY